MQGSSRLINDRQLPGMCGLELLKSGLLAGSQSRSAKPSRQNDAMADHVTIDFLIGRKSQSACHRARIMSSSGHGEFLN